MAEQESTRKGRRRRYLTAAEKYQVWLEVISGQGTQREIADKWGLDRSTVTHIVKTARESALRGLAASRPGRPGKSPEEAALEDARGEIGRLKATLCAQAIELHLVRGKDSWD